MGGIARDFSTGCQTGGGATSNSGARQRPGRGENGVKMGERFVRRGVGLGPSGVVAEVRMGIATETLLTTFWQRFGTILSRSATWWRSSWSKCAARLGHAGALSAARKVRDGPLFATCLGLKYIG